MNLDSNLLSAAALALTALAIFFGLWEPELSRVKKLPMELQRTDREPTIAEVKQALRTKSIPLTIASCLVLAATAPPFIAVLCTSVDLITKRGIRIDDYDAVLALFALVWMLLAGLAVLSIRHSASLRSRLSELSRD